MPATFQIPSVSLRVADLERTAEFYIEKLGFVALTHSATEATLGGAPGGPVLLRLLASPTAQRAPVDAAGLFHAAILLPTRRALADWVVFAARREARFDGFSDHGVSEAIYLSDPEGNGLEFYADRPRDAWPFAANGELAMTTRPLDVHGLATQAQDNSHPLKDAVWGHLHFRVTNLDQAEAFYRDHLGLAVTQRSYPGARFMAADQYHHHLGLNSWGNPRSRQPAGANGFAGATIRSALVTAPKPLTDPDGLNLWLEPASATPAS